MVKYIKYQNLTKSFKVSDPSLVGWLFWAYRPFETVFQSISGRLPEGGRQKRKVIDERKNVQTPPPQSAPTASAIGPCPTIIQISRTPRHWKFTQHLRTTRPPPPPSEPSKVGQDSKLNVGLTFTVQDVCMTQVSEKMT